VALTYQSTTTSTTGTCNKPPSTASGDHLAAVVYGAGSTTAASLAGWTPRLAINDGSFASLTVLTKTAGGSEPANYTFTGPALVDASMIVRATGTGGTLTVDGTASFATTSASPAAIPSLTTAIANSLLLMAVTNTYSGSPPDIAQPGTATEIAEFKSGNGFVILEAAYEVKATAGATGTRSFTSASGTAFGFGVMIALNEVSSTPATVNAVVATESSAAPIPTPKAASKVTGVVATLSAQFNIPTVGVFTSATVNAVVATESSSALAPTLKTAARVTGVAATLSALMPTPTVTGQQPATVAAVTATEQAQMFAPTFAVKARVTAVVATESAQMVAPSIGVPLRVSVPVMTLTAAAFAPVVTAKVVVAAPAATLALAASLPAVAVGFAGPELVTAMPGKGRTLTWSDPSWPGLANALVGVTVSPGFEALVFDAYVRDNDTVVLELSAADAATLNAGRIAPYQMTADFDDRRALVLAQGLFVATIPGVVMDGDALRNPRAITQGTAATLTWSDPAWPALDDVLVTVVVGAGRNERRYETVIDAGDVVTLDLTATGAQFDPGVYSYEVRADFDATRVQQLAVGLLTVNAA